MMRISWSKAQMASAVDSTTELARARLRAIDTAGPCPEAPESARMPRAARWTNEVTGDIRAIRVGAARVAHVGRAPHGISPARAPASESVGRATTRLELPGRRAAAVREPASEERVRVA
jgi:hypothetical protein